MMNKTSDSTQEILARTAVSAGDTWDLSPLYADVSAWEADLEHLKTMPAKALEFQGKLGTSVELFETAARAALEHFRLLEKVYTYAQLQSDGDTSNSENFGRKEQAIGVYTQLAAAWSFFKPEILAIDEETLNSFLQSENMADLKRSIEETIRYKPYTLSTEEEGLLAAGAEVFQTASKVFSQLNNADLSFADVEVDGEKQSLTHGTFHLFLKNPSREIRKLAYERYYDGFEAHKHTIAATLSSSIKKDVYLSRARGYGSAREAALFHEQVGVSVYDNLVDSVSENLGELHKYYEVRKKALNLDELRIYDTYVPLLSDIEIDIPYEEACDLLLESFQPLGDEYCEILSKGLRSDRWVDRYENKGKRSGAYSSGCYDSLPYILMNYKAKSLNSVFTLAHEAGHSMHSYYSRKNQAYQDSQYTIFVAEVASTFNEQLLVAHLKQKYAADPQMLTYLCNSQVDDIKATFHRQTMFAEFEHQTHAVAEQHLPLTLENYREIYSALLNKYFGPAVNINETDSLECFRIPHFYSAFYVYKYSTGIAAAVALSQAVLSGDKEAKTRFLEFLKSGCSKSPLELLQDAGVDMTAKKSLQPLFEQFSSLVAELSSKL